jgi:hypothetical protein
MVIQDKNRYYRMHSRRDVYYTCTKITLKMVPRTPIRVYPEEKKIRKGFITLLLLGYNYEYYTPNTEQNKTFLIRQYQINIHNNLYTLG